MVFVVFSVSFWKAQSNCNLPNSGKYVQRLEIVRQVWDLQKCISGKLTAGTKKSTQIEIRKII